MDTLIRPRDLAKCLSISILTLYRRIKELDFPKKILISSQASGFKESEVSDWIDSKQEA